MQVAPTAGIAAAWSAAKAAPNAQAVQPAGNRPEKAGSEPQKTAESKSPPAPAGQGTQVDVRV